MSFDIPDGKYQMVRRYNSEYQLKNNFYAEVTIQNKKINGPAKLYTHDGRVYEIIFKESVPHGPALKTDSLGNTISFNVENGMPKGKAIEKIRDREIHFNFNANGKRNGTAKEINSYGTIEFKYSNGIRELGAKITGTDNKIYNLFYYKDKPNGACKIFLPNGTMIYCIYENGYPHGEARMILPNKNEIIYSYVKGIPEGPATEIVNKGYSKFTVFKGIITFPITFFSNLKKSTAKACNLDELKIIAAEYGLSANQHILNESLYIDKGPIHDLSKENEPNATSTSSPSDQFDLDAELKGEWINDLDKKLS